MDDEVAEISVLDSAFLAADLPKATHSDYSLGSDEWDRHIGQHLKHAGVTIEQVGSPAFAVEAEQALHVSTQVVSETNINAAMQKTEVEDISFAENTEVLGVSVKLNNAYAWKVTIEDVVPDRATAASRRPKRGRQAADQGKTTVQSYNLYEIVVNCSDTEECHLRATVAAAQLITINIMFAVDSKGDVIINSDGYQEIGQRRVDVIFTNKHVVTTQVRSGTPRSVSCVLLCVMLLAT